MRAKIASYVMGAYPGHHSILIQGCFLHLSLCVAETMDGVLIKGHVLMHIRGVFIEGSNCVHNNNMIIMVI
jgi:hypothetical protein